MRAAATSQLRPAPAIDEYLALARANLDRVTSDALVTEVREGAVVINIRPLVQRERDGSLPGAVLVDRNVSSGA